MARSRSLRALLHALVEVLQRSVEPLLGGTSFGDVLERAEDADDLAVEVAQRDLLGLDPTQITTGPAQALDDPDDRLTGLGDMGVPVHEPVGAELGVVGPRHVAIGLADQVVRFGPGEGGEDAVAAEVPRLAVLPEHGVGRRVHQHLEQLLARLQRVVAAHPSLQQGGVEVDVRANVGFRTSLVHGQPVDLLEHGDVVVVRVGEPEGPLRLHRALRPERHDVGPAPRVRRRVAPGTVQHALAVHGDVAAGDRARAPSRRRAGAR